MSEYLKQALAAFRDAEEQVKSWSAGAADATAIIERGQTAIAAGNEDATRAAVREFLTLSNQWHEYQYRWTA